VPVQNLSDPKIKIYLPDKSFAEIDIKIIESNQTISSDYINLNKISLGYVIVDLTNVTEIGAVWNNDDDGNLTMFVDLEYYLSSPTLDVGDNYNFEWQGAGEFDNETVTIDENTYSLVNELDLMVTKMNSGYSYIPITLNSVGTGNITIDNVSVTYVTENIFYGNIIIENKNGTYFKNSYGYLINNNITNNEYDGINSTDSSGLYIISNFISNNTCGIKDNNNDLIITNNNITLNHHGLYLISTDFRINNNNIISNDYGIVLKSSCTGTASQNSMILNLYGMYIDSTSPTISNSTLILNNYTIFCKNSSPIISNSTFHNCIVYDFNLTSNSQMKVYDSYLTTANIITMDTSKITIYRNLIVNVLDDGYDWIDNATVNITFLANSTNVFNGATNSKGKINTKPYQIYFQNASVSDSNSTYMIQVEKSPLGKNKVNTSLEMYTDIKEHLSFIASDHDNDGLNDGEELYLYRTNPKSNDTDADGIWDGVEVGLQYPTTNTTDTSIFIPDQDLNTTTSPVIFDSDSDGLSDGIEDSSYDGIVNSSETDPNDPDSDNDGILDGWEQDWDVDTDGDGNINALDTDSDNDTLPDGTEDVNRDGNIGEGELDPLVADTDSDGWLDNNTNYLIELKLLNVTGCGNYSITVHGIRHPSNTTQFYNSSENISVVISTGYVQQNINITLRDENNNTIARFLVSSNRSNNFTIYLIYNNISINISSRIFYYNVSKVNDTDDDGISDLRELIYWSAHGANCTTVDTDNNGTINICDPDSDGDYLLDGEEMSGTPVRSASSDLNIYKANNNQLFNYTGHAGDLYAYFKPYSANNTHSYISVNNKTVNYFATNMSSNGTVISYNQNVASVINGSSIWYSNIYLNTSLIHRIENSGLNCTYKLIGLPQGVTGNLTYGSVFYFNTSDIFLYVEGIKQTTSFITNKTIEFRDSSGYVLWFIGNAFAIDDNDNSAECVFDVTLGSNQINFNVILPYSFLNNPSTAYPVEVEYSSADTGDTKGFVITTTVDFDQGTKNNVKTYTDDPYIPLGQMQVGFLPDEDLAAYYPIVTGSGSIIIEESGNGQNGTIYGSNWTSHASNYALDHDGIDDYETALNGPNPVNIDSEFYVQAWIKAEVSELTYQAIVDKHYYHGGDKARGFTFYLSLGKLRLSIYTYNNGNGNVFGTSDLRDNAWHKVAGSWDGEKMKVFVDGSLEGEVTWSYAPYSNVNEQVTIGKRLLEHGGKMYFQGMIDDVRIYETEFQSSSGTWTSAMISDIPAGKRLVSTTIEHYIPDGSKISKIEWNSGGAVEAMYDNYGDGITSGSSTSITNLDLSSGSFNNIRSRPFTIKIYMEGEKDILAITEIRGSYALKGQPVADAGENQCAGLNEEVQLNGSGSFDPYGHSLTYNWGKTKAPEDINFEPSSSVMSPSFTPNKKGLYKLRLVVNNGKMDSDPDHVYVAVNIPIAIIDGHDEAVNGSTVQLHGSESYSPHGKIIAYSWSVKAPDESSPYLYGAGSQLSFKVNKLGTYVVQLSVKDIKGYHSPTETLYLYVIWPWSKLYLLDSDGDGLIDGDEKYKDGTHGDTDGYITNPENTDTDGDTLWDGLNISEGGVTHRGEQSVQVYGVTTNPTKPDSDGDEINDDEEVDTGEDGYITNPMSIDTDLDFIYDLEEMMEGNDGYITDPTDPDTDDDGALDGYEVNGWPVHIWS
jgi:hypothetical protein